MDARTRRKVKKDRAFKAKMQRRIDMGIEAGRGVAADVAEDAAQQGGAAPHV